MFVLFHLLDGKYKTYCFKENDTKRYKDLINFIWYEINDELWHLNFNKLNNIPDLDLFTEEISWKTRT